MRSSIVIINGQSSLGYRAECDRDIHNFKKIHKMWITYLTTDASAVVHYAPVPSA